MPIFKVLSTSRDRVGECPVWSAAEQALYWVDIEGKHIHRYDWMSKTQQTWVTDERVGCIACVSSTEGGKRVIAAMETNKVAFTRRYRAPHPKHAVQRRPLR
jgi:sugar lactone lactonase YvrE